MTEGVRRKLRRFNGSGQADLRGFSPKSWRLSDSGRQCEKTSVDTFAPHQLNSVCGFRGQAFPQVKARTCLGRGALRLSQSFVFQSLARLAMESTSV
jgi:hypothetical protein